MRLDLPREEGELSPASDGILYQHEVNSMIDYVVMESEGLGVVRKDNKILVRLHEFRYGNVEEIVHEMPASDAIAMAKAIIATLGDGS